MRASYVIGVSYRHYDAVNAVFMNKVNGLSKSVIVSERHVSCVMCHGSSRCAGAKGGKYTHFIYMCVFIYDYMTLYYIYIILLNKKALGVS